MSFFFIRGGFGRRASRLNAGDFLTDVHMCFDHLIRGWKWMPSILVLGSGTHPNILPGRGASGPLP